MNLQSIPAVHRPRRGFDLDILAEQAATMIRKGADVNEVCQALRLTRATLRQLAHDYDFRYPTRRVSYWPLKDEPGEWGDAMDDRDEICARARIGARRTLLANGAALVTQATAKPPVPWPEQPPAVFYDHCDDTTPPRTAADVIMQVCMKHGVSRQAIVGDARQKAIVAARQEAAFRIVVELGFSLGKTGRLLGKRDHTTILHSVKRHADSSPAAALAYREYCRAAAVTDDGMREQVIHLHFNEGTSINEIRRRLPLSRDKIMTWLLAEVDARKDKAA